MGSSFSGLLKSKTFWMGLAGVVAGAGAYFTGNASLAQAIQIVLTGGSAITLRHAMAKQHAQVSWALLHR